MRFFTTAGCSAATQNRNVATTCLRRERPNRYNSTIVAEIVPNSAKNCASERFRKYIQAITRERTSEPKMMSSIGIPVETPT